MSCARRSTVRVCARAGGARPPAPQARLAAARAAARAASRRAHLFPCPCPALRRAALNAGIIGLSNALLMDAGAMGPDTAKTLATICHSGARLLNLINDILDASALRKVGAARRRRRRRRQRRRLAGVAPGGRAWVGRRCRRLTASLLRAGAAGQAGGAAVQGQPEKRGG